MDHQNQESDEMSQNIKRGLLIGGGILALLCVISVASFIFTRSAGGIGGSATSNMPLDTDMIYAVEEMAGEAAPASPDLFAGGGDASSMGFSERAADGSLVPPSGAPQVAATGGQEQQIQRLIIKNGIISIYSEDTRGAQKKIEETVAQLAGDGAFIVSSDESGGYGEDLPYINIVIRVPASHFDEVMDTIAGLAAKGTSVTRNESGQDVTDEYVDVKARVQSLEAARDRLLQIMAEAQNTNDLLLAEQQLAQREAEIEALKGRMQYLEQSAALSSITITLQPYILSQPVDTRWNPAETFRNALDGLLNDLREFGDFLITFVVRVLLWLVVAGLVLWFGGRFVYRRVIRWMDDRKVASSGSND
jgi:hypothetical protein